MTRPRLDALIGLALFLFALAIQANSAAGGFIHDDQRLIELNEAIRDLANLPELLRSDYWSPVSSGLYRPLVTLSYLLNHELGGLDPRGYHVLNIVLHACNCVLVWILSRAASRKKKAPFQHHR